MQPSALRALEFDRIVEAVADFALTPMGDERLARLAPSTDPQKVAQLLAATTETARYLAANAPFPLRASAELPQILAALAVEGRALEPLRLLALANFLDSVDETRAAIRRAAGSFPLLDAASGGAASFKGETAQTRDKIDPSGDVVDHASPELKLLRDRLRKQRSRLRSTLESYLRGKDTAKYLQDQVVTERNGRYVLVIKAEHRSGIPGIVHGHVDQRREPVSRAAQHGRDQQRHRRARGAGRRRSPAHPARADRRVPRARGGPAAHDRGGHRARRAAGAGALLRVDRRRRAGAVDRRRVRAAGGAASAAQIPVPVTIKNHSAGDGAAGDRPEHRRQDRRAQDRGPARADGAGGAAHSRRRTDRGCRCSGRSSPTSATSSRSTRA